MRRQKLYLEEKPTRRNFPVDSRVRAIINHRMADRSERDKRSACMYQMMQRFCFHAYDVSDKQTKMDIDYFSNAKLPALSQEHIVREQTAHRCNDRTLYEQLRIADTLGVGFPTLMGTDLIKRLLRWDPTNRVAADKALTHAYFTNPNGDKPFVCSLCGKEMVFMSDYRRHMAAKECNHS
ncbi:hypothetical protein, variant [Sphaeroforma arctica JP610]|uniref:C2H2-type domain-containing protein n=1 Tax=Sphaeroforma arctica JP610 TaxID=667725 RepID=A0A0L0G140_9EUKA|nr:hypothetical protein, variant [Sphaeroforma arctica JP610]KNC81913.1 hypothetical protein, variant [Sphaeroforma arctica JP610]|eukprot:XP_014155815.1 hypothetical protein, variant [Sphaeroforma arctica JP610]